MNNKELTEKLNSFAGQLPIGKKLKDLNFSHPGILIGETACGKSLVTPVMAYLTGGFRRIIIRQPTRLASYLIMKSMTEIYGDSIKVGCINRDQKINPEAPILEVTDGILVDWLRDKQIWYDELLILDEIHATSEQLEIAMGLIKRQGLQPWCLTATIDPKDIKNYFNSSVYYVSGINYPINKKQLFTDLKEFLLGSRKTKGYIEDKMLDKGHSCMVFLPTRYETEKWASEIEMSCEGKIICKYVHGGIDVKEMAPYSHKDNLEKPFILFSTPVSEQSITLDLDDVIVVDQKIKVNEYMGVKVQQRTNLPPNSLIQMMGRCGRYREGNVYVISDDYSPEIDFENLRPTSVNYTLSDNTPFELALILAGTKIKLQDVELITKVDKKEYDFAVKMLKKRRLIKPDGTLTREGEAVMNIPLDYNLAQFVATAPNEILDIVIFTASFGSHSLYHMEKFFPEGVPYKINRERKKLAVSESDLLTKYNIAKEFHGLSEEEMKVRAEEIGLNLHVILNALNAASSVYDHLELYPPEVLYPLNTNLIKKFQEHVFNIMLYPPVKVMRNYYGDGYSCNINYMRAFTDSSASIKGGEKEVIFSLRTQVENRHGEWFIRLSDNTICPKKFQEWCWPEETVSDFIVRSLNVNEKGYVRYKISEERYPAIANYLKSLEELSDEMEKLYNKSPERFKSNRITFIDLIEDELMEICINERIKSLNKLEIFLEKETVYIPEMSDFIEVKDKLYIESAYPDEIKIRDTYYPLFYKNGEKFVELPCELILELKEEEVPVTNFITIVKEGNKKEKKLQSHSLESARNSIKYHFCHKAWKKVKKSLRQKVKPGRLVEIEKDILCRKYITEFQGEPFYGWTGLIFEGKTFTLHLFNDMEQAEKETRKTLEEYISYMVKKESNIGKRSVPQNMKDRKKVKKEVERNFSSLENELVKELETLDLKEKKAIINFSNKAKNRLISGRRNISYNMGSEDNLSQDFSD